MTGARSLFDLFEDGGLGATSDDVRRAMLAEAVDSAAIELRPTADAYREGSFAGYVRRHNPTLFRYEHIPRLVDVGERVIAGAHPRVLVIMPPRYFKSEVFSRLLPGAFLRRRPDAKAGLASYGAQLAWELSEEARNYFESDGGILRSETKAKRRWRNRELGEMWADGVGGSLLGRGYHLGIVDDPTDPEKAHSPTYQRRFETWWPEKFLSRQEPGASIVVVMQRLGVDDPIDFLFRREVGEDTDEAPESWHVVVCDEIRSDDPLGRWEGPRGLPPTCTIEPDPRPSVSVAVDIARGDVPPVESILAPSRFGPVEVARLQRGAGAYVASAQRQQRPAAPTGDFWRLDWFEEYDELPADAYDGGWDWDLAYTKDEANSASAGVETYRGPTPCDPKTGRPIRGADFPIYVNDVDWEYLEFPQLVGFVRGKGGPHYIEDKASGKSAEQTLRAQKIGVALVRVTGGDKFARASAVQPVVSNRRVFVRSAVRRRLLLGERQGLLRVTAETLIAGGPDLDVNDAFVQGLTRHTGGRRRVAVVSPSRSSRRASAADVAAAADSGSGTPVERTNGRVVRV